MLFAGRGIWYQHTMAGKVGKRLRRTGVALQGVLSWRPWRRWRSTTRGLTEQTSSTSQPVHNPTQPDSSPSETEAAAPAVQGGNGLLRWLPARFSLWTQRCRQRPGKLGAPSEIQPVKSPPEPEKPPSPTQTAVSPTGPAQSGGTTRGGVYSRVSRWVQKASQRLQRVRSGGS